MHRWADENRECWGDSQITTFVGIADYIEPKYTSLIKVLNTDGPGWKLFILSSSCDLGELPQESDSAESVDPIEQNLSSVCHQTEVRYHDYHKNGGL